MTEIRPAAMRTLVTGAGGMLGSGLVPELVRAGHEVIATDIRVDSGSPFGAAGPPLRHLDVRDRGQFLDAMNDLRPDLLVHMAAETSLEVCDANPDHAWATNTIAVKHAALAAQEARIPLVYISTAGVFDGKKETAYDEFDAPNPLNIYGRSKFEGERYVQSFCDRYFIMRAGWMVGGGAKDHKFVAKMLDQIRGGSRRLYAVGDKLGTPTYVPDFARCFHSLLDSRSYGLYHMACEGEGSRFDVAGEILRILGLDDQIELVEVSSDFFADDYPSVRPRSEIMRNLALELQGLNLMRPWRIALEEYLFLNFAELADPRRTDRVIDLGAQRLAPNEPTPALTGSDELSTTAHSSVLILED
jgi:dTDP-4-dehydrorhamnose reductase